MAEFLKERPCLQVIMIIKYNKLHAIEKKQSYGTIILT